MIIEGAHRGEMFTVEARQEDADVLIDEDRYNARRTEYRNRDINVGDLLSAYVLVKDNSFRRILYRIDFALVGDKLLYKEGDSFYTHEIEKINPKSQVIVVKTPNGSYHVAVKKAIKVIPKEQEESGTQEENIEDAFVKIIDTQSENFGKVGNVVKKVRTEGMSDVFFNETERERRHIQLGEKVDIYELKISGLSKPKNFLRLNFVKEGDIVLYKDSDMLSLTYGKIYEGTVSGLITDSDLFIKIKLETPQGSFSKTVGLSSILRVLFKEDESPQQNVFESITSSIMGNVITEFENRGVMPSLGSFYFCHLPPSLRKSVLYCDRANGSTEEQIEVDFSTTIDEMRLFDREVAKTLLKHIQNNGNMFDTEYAFSTILYNCFSELSVFNMPNTVIRIPSNSERKQVVSISRNGDFLTVYYEDANEFKTYTFLQQIMFNSSKNFIKFAMWKEQRTENIQLLYNFLYFIVSACREEKKVIDYPEVNKEIGLIYLQQLKALENAV